MAQQHQRPVRHEPNASQMRQMKADAQQSVQDAADQIKPIQQQVMMEQMRKEREERHRRLAELKKQQQWEKEAQLAKEKGSSPLKDGKVADVSKPIQKDEDAQEQKTILDEQVSVEKPKKKKKRLLKWIIAGIITLFVLIAGGVGAVFYCLSPVSDSTETVFVSIPEGSTITEAAWLLQYQGLIHSARVFKLYGMGLHSEGKNIQAGRYKFSPSMSCQEILDKMIQGDICKGEITVVIPEGKCVTEIADILAENKICSADAFKKECAQLSKYKAKYPILASIPNDQGRDLEGYLFPATYSWDKNTKPDLIVDEMLACFVSNYAGLYLEQADDMGKTVDEIVIMASIVELETKFDEDKPKVASVFYNRIETGMPLQSDITVDYALGSKHSVLSTDQTKVDSLYNTYIYYGLPVGPICSPSTAAIEAALYPADTNYLYFVADMDTGKIYYNETLEGHNEDVAKHMK